MINRLVKVAKELNVGTTTIVDYLTSHGFDIEDRPSAKLTDEMYDQLLREFQKDRSIKEQADQLTISTPPAPREEIPLPTLERPRLLQSRIKVLGKIDIDTLNNPVPPSPTLTLNRYLFKVAADIEVSEKILIEYLIEEGYTSENRNSFTISDQLFEKIIEKFIYPRVIEKIEYIKNNDTSFLLDLSNHFLKTIPEEVFELSYLHKLDISRNRISEIPRKIGLLPNLKELNISHNKITELPEEILQLKSLKTFNADGNQFQYPPQEIIDKGLNEIKSFLINSKEQGDEYIYEAKLILVGEPGAGKTTLAKKLINPKYKISPIEPMTKGIEVYKWSFPYIEDIELKKIYGNKEILFESNIWDFGGQEIMYATHHYFLTKRSLYILLADNRKEDTNFYYWLNKLQSLSDKSPVLIVLNEKDGYSKNVPTPILNEFDSIKEIISVNLASNKGLKELTIHIKRHLRELEHVEKELIPTKWHLIRNELDNLKTSKDYISLDDYMSICNRFKVYDEDQIFRISDFLHDLGVILHFQDDVLLQNLVILNTTWATEAVYLLLFDKKVKDNDGKFYPWDLKRLWKAPIYPRSKHADLLKLMINFKICYEIRKNKELYYIAPHLLPDSVPEQYYNIINQYEISLMYEYRYSFMPQGIISHLIVQMHSYVYKKLQWKNGVVLKIYESLADISIGFSEGFKVLKIKIFGNNRKEALLRIREEVNELHSSYKAVKFEERLPCICDKCKYNNEPYFFSLPILRKYQEKEKQEITCNESVEDVFVLDVLGKVFLDEKNNKISEDVKIFISYSESDNKYKEEFYTHISSLRTHKKIATWDINNILPGEKISEAFTQNLNSANVVLIFLSANYINNCKDELNQILELHKIKKTITIPILLRVFAYEDLSFAQMKMLPQNNTPISRWSDSDAAWTDIIKGLKTVLKQEFQFE